MSSWLQHEKDEILNSPPEIFKKLHLDFTLKTLISIEEVLINTVNLENFDNPENKRTLDFINTYIGETAIKESDNQCRWAIDLENDYEGITRYFFLYYILSKDEKSGLVPNSRLRFALNKKIGSTIFNYVSKKIDLFK